MNNNIIIGGNFIIKMLTDTAILMCSIFPYRTLVSWLLLPPLFQLTMVEKETALTVSQVVATHILLLHIVRCCIVTVQ